MAAPVSNRSVVTQQIPVDPKAGPVSPANKPSPSKVATSAPRPIVKETVASVAPVSQPSKATSPKAAVIKAAPAKVAKEDPKKAAKDNTPSLRMTADAAAP